MALGQGHDIPLGYGQPFCEILSKSNLVLRSCYGPDTDFSMWELWLWLWDMTFCQDHDTPLGYGKQLREILSRTNLANEELWPEHRIGVSVHCNLDLGDMALGQVHDTSLGNGQQLCEILSRSSLTVRSYGPDTELEQVCTVTLTFEIWPWFKVMTHPWVLDKGETITRVNGNVSFFAGKRLQNS